MIKQNIHTHSTYCDGKNTLEEMIEAAIRKNFTVLGFSGHAFSPYDIWGMSQGKQSEYRVELMRLKEKYKDCIDIFIGIEQDITYITENPADFDFIIGSKHYMEHCGEYREIDESRAVMQSIIDDWYDGNFVDFAKDYYNDIKQIAFRDEITVVGHIDLLTKYNETETFISFDDKEYLQYAFDAIDCLIRAGKIFEVNTGAISRGYRSTPYPHKTLLKYIRERGGKILLNSDCHEKNRLDCGYDNAMNLIKEAGFSTMMLLTSDGFKEVNIGQFAP